ncbi:MAG: type II toxin-antitoxin system RelE/ParE family toxin [Acidobacteriaceae bacterium]|nr:type II toxin-antitoxin system RelE/ParE family toxin [Acidobacteriaceae bacterium]MBV9779011.1 type II toxin-antitoxin system RelE/ParE family toxin [Acidobacteriaceae bacterium]
MAWEVEFRDEFGRWWRSLSESQQDDVAYSGSLLAELGPTLGFPHSSKVTSSRYAGMRELRTQSAGRPLRTLYIFDASRTAILLIGGDKTGNDRWYEQFVPVADRIYRQYLDELRKEDSNCEREHALETVGHGLDDIRERIRQIEAKALRQLRSPERARYLRALLAVRGKF